MMFWRSSKDDSTFQQDAGAMASFEHERTRSFLDQINADLGKSRLPQLSIQLAQPDASDAATLIRRFSLDGLKLNPFGSSAPDNKSKTVRPAAPPVNKRMNRTARTEKGIYHAKNSNSKRALELDSHQSAYDSFPAYEKHSELFSDRGFTGMYNASVRKVKAGFAALPGVAGLLGDGDGENSKVLHSSGSSENPGLLSIARAKQRAQESSSKLQELTSKVGNMVPEGVKRYMLAYHGEDENNFQYAYTRRGSMVRISDASDAILNSYYVRKSGEFLLYSAAVSFTVAGASILVEKMGIPSYIAEKVRRAKREYLLQAIFAELEPHRAYKGCGGRIVVIGGSKEYVGAPYYSCQAMLKAGAELVSLKTMHTTCNEAIKAKSNEIMADLFDPKDTGIYARAHAVLIGPGLGREKDTCKKVAGFLKESVKLLGPNKPVIIDADGIFAVCQDDFKCLQQRSDETKSYTVLTPNANEVKMLLQKAQDISPDIEVKSLSDLAHLLSNSNVGTVYILQKGKSDHIIGASKGPTRWPLQKAEEQKHNINVDVAPYVAAVKDGVVQKGTLAFEKGKDGAVYVYQTVSHYTPATPAVLENAKTRVLVKVKSWKDKLYAPEHTALFTDRVQPTLEAVAAKLAAIKEPTMRGVDFVVESKAAVQVRSVLSLGLQNAKAIAWGTVQSGVHHVASLVNLIWRSLNVSVASYGRIFAELKQIHSIRNGVLLNHMLMLRGVGDALQTVRIKGVESSQQMSRLQSASSAPQHLDKNTLTISTPAKDLLKDPQPSGESTPASGRFFLIESTTPGSTLEVINAASSDSNNTLSEMLQGGSIVMPAGTDMFAAGGDVHRRGLSEIEVDESDWVNVKRVGGIGDVLSGVVTLFCAWQEQAALVNQGTVNAYKHRDPLMALFLASTVVKRAARNGESKKKRGLSPTDVIDALPGVTEEIYPLRARASHA